LQRRGKYDKELCREVKLFFSYLLDVTPCRVCYLIAYFVCRYAYLEFASEVDTVEALGKYQGTELFGSVLYIIKSLTQKKETFGKFVFAKSFKENLFV